MAESLVRIRGEVELPADAKSFSGGTLYVRLQDTSEADAPAITLLESVVSGIRHHAGGRFAVPFELRGEIPSGSARRTVRALLDLDGDRQTSIGDYISVASYPVPSDEVSNLRISLALVKSPA